MKFDAFLHETSTGQPPNPTHPPTHQPIEPVTHQFTPPLSPHRRVIPCIADVQVWEFLHPTIKRVVPDGANGAEWWCKPPVRPTRPVIKREAAPKLPRPVNVSAPAASAGVALPSAERTKGPAAGWRSVMTERLSASDGDPNARASASTVLGELVSPSHSFEDLVRGARP